MIQAKEILDIIESTGSGSFKEKAENLYHQVQSGISNIPLGFIKEGDFCFIYSDLVLTGDALLLNYGWRDKIAPDFIDKFNGTFRTLSYQLSTYLGKSDYTIHALGIISKFYDKYSAYFEVSCGDSNPSTFGKNIDAGSVRLEFSFKEDLFSSDFTDSRDFIKDVEFAFTKFFAFVSEFRKKNSTANTLISFKDNFFSDILGKVENLVAVNAPKIGRDNNHKYFFTQSIKVPETPTFLNDLVVSLGQRIFIPTKPLSSICGQNVEFINNRDKSRFTSPALELKGISTTFTIDLYCGPKLQVVSVPPPFNGIEPGILKVACQIENFQELPFLPGGASSKEKIKDAIAYIFIGYKKLINQFINKPTKKTNTDW